MSKNKRAGKKQDAPVALAPEHLAQLKSAASMDLVESPTLDTSVQEPERVETRGFSEDRLARAAAAIANLTLAARSIEEGARISRAFKDKGAADVAEQILEQLIAGEVPVVLELQNIEGNLIALAQRCITEPALFLKVMETFKETVAVSAAVRRRMQNSMSCAAGLKAQRRMLNGAGIGNANGK